MNERIFIFISLTFQGKEAQKDWELYDTISNKYQGRVVDNYIAFVIVDYNHFSYSILKIYFGNSLIYLHAVILGVASLIPPFDLLLKKSYFTILKFLQTLKYLSFKRFVRISVSQNERNMKIFAFFVFIFQFQKFKNQYL